MESSSSKSLERPSNPLKSKSSDSSLQRIRSVNLRGQPDAVRATWDLQSESEAPVSSSSRNSLDNTARPLERPSEKSAEKAALLQDAQLNIWRGHLSEEEVEGLIKVDEVASSEDILLEGPCQPKKVTLRSGITGIFKGENADSLFGYYKSELAAYRVAKLLKLSVVPLTVEREINGEKGSFQLWVNNLRNTKLPLPNDCRFFDFLINNGDRHEYEDPSSFPMALPEYEEKGSRNWDLLDGDPNRPVLYDNAQGFALSLEKFGELPNADNVSRFKPSSKVLENAIRLDMPMLEQIEWLTSEQRKGLLQRRDTLIAIISKENTTMSREIHRTNPEQAEPERGRRSDRVSSSRREETTADQRSERHTRLSRSPISASNAHDLRMRNIADDLKIRVPNQTTKEWMEFSRDLLKNEAKRTSDPYAKEYLRAHLESPDQGKLYLERHARQINNLISAMTLVDILKDRGENYAQVSQYKGDEHYQSWMTFVLEQWQRNEDGWYTSFWKLPISAGEAHDRRMQETAEDLKIRVPDPTTENWRLFSSYLLGKEAKRSSNNPYARGFLRAHLQGPGQGYGYLAKHIGQKEKFLRVVMLIDILQDRGKNYALEPKLRDEKYYRSYIKYVLKHWEIRIAEEHTNFSIMPISAGEAYYHRMQETAKLTGIRAPEQITEEWMVFSRYLLEKEAKRSSNNPYARKFLSAHLESPGQGKGYLAKHADQIPNLVHAVMLIDILQDRGEHHLLTQTPKIRDDEDYRAWMMFVFDQWEEKLNEIGSGTQREKTPLERQRRRMDTRMDTIGEQLNIMAASTRPHYNPAEASGTVIKLIGGGEEEEEQKQIRKEEEEWELSKKEEWDVIKKEVRNRRIIEEQSRTIKKQERKRVRDEKEQRQIRKEKDQQQAELDFAKTEAAELWLAYGAPE